MLAGALRDAAREAGMAVTALARAELDVTDADAARRAVACERPDAIVNCAAYTDVDGAEDAEDDAFAVNAAGAGNLARAADEVGVLVVYPSSDYVFDGGKRTPYVESDAPAPLAAYGRSKLAGERATQAAARHLIVRSSWLFGAGGRNFVDTMLSLGESRDEVSVVADQVGSPTFTGALAEAIVALCARGVEGVAHAAGGGACSWAELAAAAFEEAGIDCRVRRCRTQEFPRPARRPAYSALETARPDVPVLAPWRTGLRRYLAQRAGVA